MIEFKGLDKHLRDINSLIREVGDVGKRPMGVLIKPLPDGDGYIDRQCPHPDCQTLFKVFAKDWEGKCRGQSEHCPRCGHNNNNYHFFPQSVLLRIQMAARNVVETEVHKAIQRALSGSSRRDIIGNEITIPGPDTSSSTSVTVSLEAFDSLQQKAECPSCGLRYAIIGAAYFCPACGINLAKENLDVAVDRIMGPLETIQSLKGTVEDDEYKKLEDQQLEAVMVILVGAFQLYAEGKFVSDKRSEGSNPRKNVFQNLNESSSLWKGFFGTSYEEMIGPTELEELNGYFQQRHLLGHKDGEVDSDYINRSGDQGYDVGQRIVVNRDHIKRMADLIKRLGKAIQETCAVQK